MKILLAEDNERLGNNIKEMLVQHGYMVDIANDGVIAKSRIRNGKYDLILLDIMLPRKDGITVCTEVREEGVMTPIIIITAKGTIDDKVLGLNAGANDYLTKPFAMKELIARVRAHTRMAKVPSLDMSTLIHEEIVLYTEKHQVYYRDVEVSLTTKEYLILEYLLANKGRVLSREQILNHCWDFAFDSFSNIVDVNIKQLRKKIAYHGELFVNPYGTQVLAKGGSGDVLSGLIASLLAQGYTPKESAINGSLALALASRKYSKANYYLLPTDIIELLGEENKYKV